MKLPLVSLFGIVSCNSVVAAFNVPQTLFLGTNSSPSITSSSSSALPMTATTAIIEPSQRDEKYGSNMAQYLVDLHDSEATFDFCGGMLFQLVLSDHLRSHLVELASSKQQEQHQPTVFSARKSRMHQIENYEKSATVDNLSLFHGREIRKVPDAKGGRGFVLHLSLANNKDPEGWTKGEVDGYDGWGHDASRDWRTGVRLEQEGFEGFTNKFGPDSFALNHRFYLHYDAFDRLWLSAEDGCEGTPAATNQNPIQSLLRKFL